MKKKLHILDYGDRVYDDGEEKKMKRLHQMFKAAYSSQDVDEFGDWCEDDFINEHSMFSEAGKSRLLMRRTDLDDATRYKPRNPFTKVEFKDVIKNLVAEDFREEPDVMVWQPVLEEARAQIIQYQLTKIVRVNGPTHMFVHDLRLWIDGVVEEMEKAAQIGEGAPRSEEFEKLVGELKKRKKFIDLVINRKREASSTKIFSDKKLNAMIEAVSDKIHILIDPAALAKRRNDKAISIPNHGFLLEYRTTHDPGKSGFLTGKKTYQPGYYVLQVQGAGGSEKTAVLSRYRAKQLEVQGKGAACFGRSCFGKRAAAKHAHWGDVKGNEVLQSLLAQHPQENIDLRDFSFSTHEQVLKDRTASVMQLDDASTSTSTGTSTGTSTSTSRSKSRSRRRKFIVLASGADGEREDFGLWAAALRPLTEPMVGYFERHREQREWYEQASAEGRAECHKRARVEKEEMARIGSGPTGGGKGGSKSVRRTRASGGGTKGVEKTKSAGGSESESESEDEDEDEDEDDEDENEDEWVVGDRVRVTNEASALYGQVCEILSLRPAPTAPTAPAPAPTAPTAPTPTPIDAPPQPQPQPQPQRPRGLVEVRTPSIPRTLLEQLGLVGTKTFAASDLRIEVEVEEAGVGSQAAWRRRHRGRCRTLQLAGGLLWLYGLHALTK
eukprot:g1279.t1